MRARRLLESCLGIHVYLDPDGPETQIPSPCDGQTPLSFTSSQTLADSTTDPNTGRRTSFKRKRDDSLSDFARNVRPFVAGSDGDGLPHYLTVSPAVLPLSSRV